MYQLPRTDSRERTLIELLSALLALLPSSFQVFASASVAGSSCGRNSHGAVKFACQHVMRPIGRQPCTNTIGGSRSLNGESSK